MDKSKRFMEAVAEKVGKRAPLMRRKGLTDKKPGMAVMIAIGGPKKSPMPMARDEEGDDETPKMSKADKIAALQEKIASLKAELALLEDEDEMEEVEEEAYEEDAEKDEASED
jgi:hypothetical protein